MVMSAARSGKSPVIKMIRGVAVILVLSLGLSACDRLRSVDAIVVRGQHQYEQGNYRAALGDFKTALDREDNNLPARVYLARTAYHLADFESAQNAVDMAIARGVQDPDVVSLKYKTMLALRKSDAVLKSMETEKALSETRRLLFRALASMDLGDNDGASMAFERALMLSPGDIDVLVEQARLFAGMGEYSRAESVITEVLEKSDDNAQAWFIKGSLLIKKGELAQAKAALTKAESLAKEQFNWSDQARLYSVLSDLGLRERNVADTAKWIAALEYRAPKASLTYYQKARLALLKDNSNDALVQLQQAVQSGEYLPARLLLANVLMMQSSFGQAEEQLNKLRLEHPENLEVRKLLAQLYLSTKRPDEARKVLPDPAQGTVQPDEQLAWLQGQTLLAVGKNDEGMRLLEQSVSENKNKENAAHALQLARAYIASGQRDKAITLLNSLDVAAGARERQSLLVLASVIGKSKVDTKREIDNLLGQYPKDANLHVAAGAILARGGELNAATTLLTRAVSLAPEDSDARLALASVYFEGKKYDLAESQLHSILIHDPKNASALQGLASLALAKGDRSQAARQLELAIGADPAAIQPRIYLAQLAIAESNFKRAVELLEQAVSVSDKTAAVLNQAGQLLFQAKQYEAALGYFEQAAAAGLKVARISAAQVNLALGQTAEARLKLEAAMADPDTQVQAVAILSQQAVQSGKLEEALQRISRLRQGKAPVQVVEELTGDAYASAGQFAAAVSSYERAVKLAPLQRLAVKEFKASVAGKLTNPERALTGWLSRKPDDISVRTLLAQYLLESGSVVAATHEFERILALTAPRDPVILNQLAWLYQLQNDARAEGMAREAYQAAPGIAAIADTYGWIHLKANKVSEAMSILEKAAAAAKNDREIQYHLAEAYQRDGQSDKSRLLLQGILADGQTFNSRADAEDLFRRIIN